MKSFSKLTADALAAYVEGQRDLNSQFPDESRDVQNALCWRRRKKNGKPNGGQLKKNESLRKRFAAFRAARKEDRL